MEKCNRNFGYEKFFRKKNRRSNFYCALCNRLIRSETFSEAFPKIPPTKNPHNSRCKGFCKIKTCCRGRDRTFTRQLAVTQSFGGRPRSLLCCQKSGSMLRLSCDPHPRDKRACLPKSFITPQYWHFL